MKKNNDDILAMMDAWDENAENFRGTVPDENKAAVLNKLKEQARLVASASAGELRCINNPFTNRERTASVILRGPHPVLLMNTDVVKQLGTLFDMADMVSFAVVDETDDIQLCFTVCDMWAEWRMENSPFTKK